MRLVSLHVEGYRSLRDVTLDGLGPNVVLYGPNGAGKSNLLDVVSLVYRVGVATSDGPTQVSDKAIWNPAHDLTHRRATGAGIRATFAGAVTVALHLECDPKNPVVNVVDLKVRGPSGALPVHPFERSKVLGDIFRGGALSIPALREVSATEDVSDGDGTDPVKVSLAGRIPEELFLAATSPDVALHDRYQRLSAVLRDPPFSRPLFRPVKDGAYRVQELRSGAGVVLDRAGLGAQQVYAITAAILLSGARVVTLEEPEAHLHMPSTGLHLRHFLQGIVPDPVEQLFVATHSSVFDLDPTGYWDVSHDEAQGTVVQRSTELVDLDRRHVYEPGAARRALLDALHRGEPDRVVAVRPDGHDVLASEMIQFLVSDDPVAVEFLKDVTEAAVRLVAGRAKS